MNCGVWSDTDNSSLINGATLSFGFERYYEINESKAPATPILGPRRGDVGWKTVWKLAKAAVGFWPNTSSNSMTFVHPFVPSKSDLPNKRVTIRWWPSS